LALTHGTRLGPYEIGALLGVGGMGEVYRARDTRLDRTVAIKVLPSVVAGDPDVRSRFEREARAVAALDHPHICGIYDVGSVGGTHYLVMPHLDGQTLAARLEKGSLPLDQALKIAVEIADALDKAHRLGITHRDVKPANIMMTKSGSKLLDFGLAKLRGPESPISMSGMTRLATVPPPTASGSILGTIHYMAPEQVEGRETDARSDIWALGVVLYEMMTGTRPFNGGSPASIIGAILKETPAPISTHQPVAPPELARIVGACLEKDPDARWQSAADVRRQLEWLTRGFTAAASQPATARRHRLGRLQWAAWASAVALALAIVIGISAPRWRASLAPDREALIFTIQPPQGRLFSGPAASVQGAQFALSPDGRQLAFIAAEPQGQTFMWIRSFADRAPRRLAGTEDAADLFWSPDSRYVAFFAKGRLKKAAIAGAVPPQEIVRTSIDSRGGAWSAADVILYSQQGATGLNRIAAGGGTSASVGLTGPKLQRWPTFLGDSDRFVYVVRDPDPSRRGIYGASLGDSGAKLIVASDWSVKYAMGHLLFLNGAVLMAQPFDVNRMALTGTAQPVAQRIGASSTAYGAFSVSSTGVLAYSNAINQPAELRWVDRAGTLGSTVADAADYIDFRLSPDDDRVAFSRTDPEAQGPDVWVLDLSRGTLSRLTSDPLTEAAPMWSPTGDEIIFRSNRAFRGLELFRTRPNPGAPIEEILTETQQNASPGLTESNALSSDWSPDGRFVLYHTPTRDTGYDIFALPLSGAHVPVPVARTTSNEIQGVASPDGRWVAYASDESGRYEVYVQAFPAPGAGQKTIISTRGGVQPRWSRDGRELFYLQLDGTLMSVTIRTRPSDAAAPTPLFMSPIKMAAVSAYRMDYVPARDGKRFLMKVPVQGATPPEITVVLNWPALLKN